MDVSQDHFVGFHLTDSSDELTSLIREVDLSIHRARGAGGENENNNQKAIPSQLISVAYARK